jgi:hypothetical protein
MVTQFVSQDCLDLVRGEFINQSIAQDNPARVTQTRQRGVG